jgi:4-amino-4-deoxy-L-arabinose transferase-like glycosyltransferase
MKPSRPLNRSVRPQPTRNRPSPSWLVPAILAVATILGLLLQLHALSSYLIYPDSYQNLVVADNLRHSGQLTAQLGRGGMVYPQFFAWTHPLYPLLILLVGATGLSLITSAHLVAVAAGTATILAAYGLVASVLQSRRAGLAAAVLLAISYDRAIWGGFVLTEPLNLLMVTLALWQLWRRRQTTSTWLKPQDLFGRTFLSGDFLTGLLLAAAILTRYENALIVLPALLWSSAPRPAGRRVAAIAATTAIFTLVPLAILHPWGGSWSQWWAQTWPQLSGYLPLAVAAVSVALLITAASFSDLFTRLTWKRWAPRTTSAGLLLAAIILLIHPHAYLGLWEFCTHDPLIAILALAGFITMLRHPRQQSAAAFALLTATLLAAVYYHTNPTMDRYLAHLLPLLIIPAAAALGAASTKLTTLPTTWRGPATAVAAIALILAASGQTAITYVGLHHRQQGLWFEPGYEAVAAQEVAQLASPSTIIVTATPEPYRLYTTAAVQNVSASNPSLQITGRRSQTLLIVQDASLRYTTPKFSHFVTTKLAAYRIASFANALPYRYVTTTVYGQNPVMVYRVTLGQLQCIISQANLTGGATCRSNS